MFFKLYDYEAEEYIVDPATSINEIIQDINTIYFYEADFVEVDINTLGDFLLNAHLQLIPVENK